mgnify:CR=1 FL=1
MLFPEEVSSFFSDCQSPAYLKATSASSLSLEQLQSSALVALKFSKQIPVTDILAEYQGIRSLLVSNHNTYPHSVSYKWKAVALHGLGNQQVDNFVRYGAWADESEVPYAWTNCSTLCPLTRKFIESLPYERLERVRFMVLGPKGFTRPHRDGKSKPNEGRLCWLNIALDNPAGSFFKFKDFGYVPFENGVAFSLNTRHEHAVVNFSDQDRVHLIVHGRPSENFLDWFM